MKNIREALQRRSFHNHILAHRHNRREDEILEEKFSLYHRRLHLVDYYTYLAERRVEQHARNDLGFTVTWKPKSIAESSKHKFYYPAMNKNWIIKEYSVEPLNRALQQKYSNENQSDHRYQQYVEESKQKRCLQQVRKVRFIESIQFFFNDDANKFEDWPQSDKARLRLPSIDNTNSKHSYKLHFSLDI